jgi:hypothetical protein
LYEPIILYLLVHTNSVLIGSYKFCTYWFIQILYLLVHTNSVYIGSYTICTYWFIQILYLLVHTNSVLIGSYKFCTYWFMQIMYLLVELKIILKICKKNFCGLAWLPTIFFIWSSRFFSRSTNLLFTVSSNRVCLRRSGL